MEKLISEVKVESDDIIAVRIKDVTKSPQRNIVVVNIYDSPPNSSFKKQAGSDETLEEMLQFLNKTIVKDELLVTLMSELQF